MAMFQALFTMEGFNFILRYLHYFFGVMWIGHLYYFNFTQGTAVAQMDAAGKSNVTTKLLPQALYWFRWGAMWTMVTGLIIYLAKGHTDGMAIYKSGWGLMIGVGVVLGLTMWANVWFIIWPKQQIVMKSANAVAAGGAADPQAAKVAPQALLASRTNTLLSIPLLFLMGAASHFAPTLTPESNLGLVLAVIGVLWIAIEANAIKGKLGPMTTVKGVITSGFVLTLVIYSIMAFLL